MSNDKNLRRARLATSYVTHLEKACQDWMHKAIDDGISNDDIIYCMEKAAMLFGLMYQIGGGAFEALNKSIAEAKTQYEKDLKWKEELK
jgi:hypothetical protein